MFGRKKEKPDPDDQFVNPAIVNLGVVEGIRVALQRPDLTAEDRRELEEALKALEAKNG